MSKTVDELIGVYIEASNAVVWEAEKRGLCPMTLDMQRAGIAAVIRVLRDEIWMRTKRMDACDILLEILGPIEGEGAAKESGGRDRKYGPAQVGGDAPSPTYYIPAEDWWARFMNARIVVVHGNEILGSDAGNEKVAGGSAREDEKAVEAAGDKGPVTVNSPATDPIRDAVATARGRVLVVDDIPMLNKLAAMMSPATDAAPAVCVWTRLDPNRVDYRIACAPDPSTIYHPHPQRLASANCANCGKPITFTEANHG